MNIKNFSARMLGVGLTLLMATICQGCSPEKEREPERKSAPPVSQYVATLRGRAMPEFNQRIGFYLDLTRPSEEPRFFVLDLRQGRVLAQGLCGSGKVDDLGQVIYSNVPDSWCSSRGLAKITTPYIGQYGQAYKLVGLDSSNSEMYRRFIVLHAGECVPDEPQTDPICLSQGCPMVSTKFLLTLSGYIARSRQPILLYTN